MVREYPEPKSGPLRSVGGAGCERFIAKLGAASSLSDDEKLALRTLCSDTRVVPAKRHIIREGDNPEHIHIILNGWAARYKIQKDGSRQIVAFLLPGDVCDLHVTILRRMDHGIVAIGQVEVAFVPAETMEDVPLERPNVLRALWRATLIDEAVMRAWIANIGRRVAIERIAHLFCELHARLALIGLVTDGQFALPVTQEDIADAMGLTSVHVNRVLKVLRTQDLVRVTDGELEILDVAALRELCGFDATYLHPEQLARV